MARSVARRQARRCIRCGLAARRRRCGGASGLRGLLRTLGSTLGSGLGGTISGKLLCSGPILRCAFRFTTPKKSQLFTFRLLTACWPSRVCMIALARTGSRSRCAASVPSLCWASINACRAVAFSWLGPVTCDARSDRGAAIRTELQCPGQCACGALPCRVRPGWPCRASAQL